MMRSIVAQEHGNGCRGDDDVANPAENIGNLTEDEIAENCRKDNLKFMNIKAMTDSKHLNCFLFLSSILLWS